MKIVRQLAEDGLEGLGTLHLPAAVAIGDPAAFGAPSGSGRWFGATVMAGPWWMFGRASEADPDVLEEVVLVHETALPSFYTVYDEIVTVATIPVERGRVAVLAGGLHKDAAVLRGLVEPDALPWVYEDRGVVVEALGEWPVTIAASRGSPLVLIAVGLGRPPDHLVPTQPFSAEDGDDD